MGFQDFRQLSSCDGCAAPEAGEPQMATAAELMFFQGAPLAHVVAYREHLRMERIARRNQEFSRRIRGLRTGLRGPLLAGGKRAG